MDMVAFVRFGKRLQGDTGSFQRRLRRFAGQLACAALLAGGIAAGPAAAQSDFYEFAPNEIAGPPGSMIRAERIIGGPFDATAYRILYRSTGLHGESIPVSGIVVVPDGPAPAGGRPIVAWAHPTTGAVSRCAPSLQLNVFDRIQGLKRMLANGFAVVATDYPGLGTPGPHPYLVGLSEGRAVLDSVRAARDAPGVGRASQFIVWGHSQGGHAALFAGILARQYAPDLRLIGVAAAAPATDLATLMTDDFASPGGKNLTALALWSWSQVYRAPLEQIVVPEAIATVDKLAQECTDTVEDVLIRLDWERPLQQEFLTVPDVTAVQPWRGILARNSPGPLPRGVPAFIAQGTGDKTVRPAVTAAYIRSLCHQGTPVDGVIVPDTGHAFIARDTADLAVDWMATLFAGGAPPNTCGAG